jgi:hypothetical protein
MGLDGGGKHDLAANATVLDPWSGGLQRRHDEPPLRPPPIDQLLGRETRSGSQVRQVPFRRARPHADERRCFGNGPAGGNEGSEDAVDWQTPCLASSGVWAIRESEMAIGARSDGVGELSA